jgi:hypothetical protein
MLKIEIRQGLIDELPFAEASRKLVFSKFISTLGFYWFLSNSIRSMRGHFSHSAAIVASGRDECG